MVFSVVANGGSSRIDAIAECRFRNNTAIPDRSNEIVLADHTLAVSDQIREKIKDLRLHGHESSPAAELTAAGIESIVFEEIKQLANFRADPTGASDALD